MERDDEVGRDRGACVVARTTVVGESEPAQAEGLREPECTREALVGFRRDGAPGADPIIVSFSLALWASLRLLGIARSQAVLNAAGDAPVRRVLRRARLFHGQAEPQTHHFRFRTLKSIRSVHQAVGPYDGAPCRDSTANAAKGAAAAAGRPGSRW